VTSLAAAGVPQSAFTEEALARGINFNLTAYPQTQGYVGQGCGFVDFDNDGDPDVVILGASTRQVGIYENIGGSFVSHSATSGIPTIAQHEGISAGDYDGDGFLDLYITQSTNQPNLLFKNNGNFTFTNVSAVTGVSNGLQNSTGSSWADYNNDGWLDLYVNNYSQLNALYRNNGGNNFSNLGPALGVTGGAALSFQTVWTDIDRDGDVDLYLSNDRGHLTWPPNAIWRNDDGIFTDISVGSGADVAIFSMGIGAGDVDNNLYPDIYLTNIFAVESNGKKVQYDGVNPLLLNQTDETFVDQTELWETDNRISSWAATFFDWDNDGFKDLYVVNHFDPNSFFVCEGTFPCVERAVELNVIGQYDSTYDLPDHVPDTASYNAAVADVDGDGDVDVLTTNLGGRVQLYINHEGAKRNSLRLDIVGEHPNLHAIGASVEVDAAGMTQYYENYAGGNGYLGQNELVIHVGLDDDTTATETRVQWPSAGPSRTLTHLPANTQWEIYPPSRLCDHDGDGVDYDDFIEFSSCFVDGFSLGCEMMDHSGNSSIYTEDLDACFVDAAADCNGNGTEDLAEIMLDNSMDNDQNKIIDCCEGGPVDDPNPVGATLLVGKNGSGDALLSWSAPAVDGSHAAATGYDVFRRELSAVGPFELLDQVGGTSASDSDPITDVAYYLIGARNGCGSSGEEPF